MDCVICCTSLLHLFHEPMSMGCKCQERLCQRCFKVGDVHKCPTCRKPKKEPKVDRKWLRREWKQGKLSPCLGCEKEVYTRYLHKHEMRCIKYRNLVHTLFEEDMRMRRVQNEQNQATITEMESRLDLQADLIEDLEEQVENLEQVTTRQEEERQLYMVENTRLLRSLESMVGPLYTSMRSLDAVYSRMSQTACSLRASRAHHQLLRRQHQHPHDQYSQQQHQHHHQYTAPVAGSVPPPPPPSLDAAPALLIPPAYPPPPSESGSEAEEGDGSPAQSPYQTPPHPHLHSGSSESSEDLDLDLEEGEVVEDEASSSGRSNL